jgi:hypothetical protein
MGSKDEPQRNDNDTFIIPTPILEGAGFAPATQDVIAERCDAVILIKLDDSYMTHQDVPVYLKKIDSLYGVFALSVQVGSLNKKQSEMVDECEGLNVRYAGSIVKIKNAFYAKLQRIIR